MTTRASRTMFTGLFVAGSLLIAFALASVYQIGQSHAQGSAVALIDAGSPGSAVGSAAPAPTPPALHDPTVSPVDFLQDMRDAKKHGWPLAVMLGVIGLCELLAFAGKKNAKLAWLGKGRTSLLIGGGVAVATAGYNALASGGAWSTVGAAVVMAGLAYWHLAGTDPAKA